MTKTKQPRCYGGLRVLIAGGGVAGLEALLALRALAGDLVDLELLAPEPAFWYRPLAVAEPFDAGRAHHFELAAIAESASASSPRSTPTPAPPAQVRARRSATTRS